MVKGKRTIQDDLETILWSYAECVKDPADWFDSVAYLLIDILKDDPGARRKVLPEIINTLTEALAEIGEDEEIEEGLVIACRLLGKGGDKK